ncbi:interferon alpha/beta receptor 1a-like isoform X3 [Garra rufa]|uniref:interferon alpha/beta receptor 1a-like isoform X3 n=1 Tax=Garra rufa TaxID=137080 RepID=UPI003CCE627C
MNALCCFGLCSVLLVKVLAGFGDLRRPENVSVDSLNTRYVLRWDWPHETNQTVTFTAQYLEEFHSRKASYEKYWTSVCVNVSEHRCDFTGAELHYHGLYLLRVRANTSQQSSSWVQIRFCPDEDAALGPPSSVKLNSVKGNLEVIISDPLTNNNQSMKTLLDNNLSYLIHYCRRSEDPQTAKVLETKTNVVTLPELDRQTWYCVRVQSRYKYYDKSSVFSDTHCARTEGPMPYWQIFLFILISVLLLFLLVLLLYFCFYKMLTSLKNIFWPAVQLPDHIQELWLSDSEKPQLLAPGSPESVCEPLVMVRPELDAVSVDEHLNAEDQDSSARSSGDSGVYSTEEDSCHRSSTHTDLQMTSKKHREELHDGTLLELCA